MFKDQILNENLALHTDKYQINMMYAHWVNGTHESNSYFDAYFRKLPFGNGYAVFAGLERIVRYINNLKFTDEFIDYLSTQEENYHPDFLEELRKWKFTGNLYSVKEGTIVFANEPLIRVEGHIFETQLVETALLNFMNYQTLVATKASRIKQAAKKDDTLLEFGTRRAQEYAAAIWGARAATISGFHATSNVLAGHLFDIPIKGTHAHAWVQDHETELEAFRKYAKASPDNVILLVDTYDTLKSGVPNAITVFEEVHHSTGKPKSYGIRLDSGDLAYLSKEAREMLDQAGFYDAIIVASNDLHEGTISSIISQGGKVDTWGVGTQLITCSDQPALGGVYKLVARDTGNGEIAPVIKISGAPEKITTPGRKKLYRIIDKATRTAKADYVTLFDETDVVTRGRIKLFDPVHTYIHQYVTDYEAVELLTPIYLNGEQVYSLPTIKEIKQYHEDQLNLFWPEYMRQLNPEIYPVNLSQKLWDMKMELIAKV